MFNYPNICVPISKTGEYAYTIFDKDFWMNDEFWSNNSNEYMSNLEIYEDIFITIKQDVENTQYLNIFVNSNEHDMSYIEKFVNMCEDEYRIYQNLSIENDIFTEYIFDKTCDDFQYYQYPFSTTKTLDTVFFKQKDEFTKKFNFFINNENWYKRTGKPYTFNIMLYGPPGCGKTSFIKAMLKSTNRYGVQIELSNDVNLRQLQKIIISDNVGDRIIPHNRRILIFEDIYCARDIVSHRSEKFKNNNLSKILNIFDGLIETRGRICIFTTNKIEYLDNAMIRPGRVDCLIKFTKCTKDMIVDIMNLFYDSNDITLEHVKDYIDESISHAEVDSICFKHEDKWKALEEILYISLNIKLGDNINIYSVNTENKCDKKKHTNQTLFDNYTNSDAIYKNKRINVSPTSPSESESETIYKNNKIYANQKAESDSDSSDAYNNGMSLINEALMTVNKYKK
jgi:GTPase SAR1 family protein